MTLPVAHVGHYLWILYLIPIAIVAGGIVKSQLATKRQPPPPEQRQHPEVPEGNGDPPAGGTG